jgi:hypothetical protein
MWDEVRVSLINSGIISNPKKHPYNFIVTAGNLAYGGKHPPHTKHKDGSMLDVDLSKLKSLVKRKDPRYPGIMHDQLHEIYEVDRDIAEKIRPPKKPFPRKRPVFTFPEDEYSAEHTTVARMFTKCIYLTLPDSIIYGSEIIVHIAKIDLLLRLREMINSENNHYRKKMIIKIKELIEYINPMPYSRKNRDKVLFDHRHHWHINYSPRLLGREGEIPLFSTSDLRRLRKKRVDQITSRAENISDALNNMNKDDTLWKEALKEPYNNSI